MATPFDETHEQLLEDLSAAVSTLERWGQQHWAAWLARDAERIRKGDTEGLRNLLRAFGGMGSINDLWLDPDRVHGAHEADARHALDELRQLLGRIWESTTMLLRELNDR